MIALAATLLAASYLASAVEWKRAAAGRTESVSILRLAVVTLSLVLLALFVNACLFGALGRPTSGSPWLAAGELGGTAAVLAARRARTRGSPFVGAAVGGVLLVAASAFSAQRVMIDSDGGWYHVPIASALAFHVPPFSELSHILGLGFRPDAYPLSGELIESVLIASAGGAPGCVLFTAVSLATALAGGVALAEILAPAVSKILRVALAVTVILAPVIVRITFVSAPDMLAVGAVLCGASLLLDRGASLHQWLIGAAIVGLGVSMKTTVMPLALVVLGCSWFATSPSRRRALLGGCVFSAVASGWYLRNFVVHGAPLWPFSRFPLGDRLPAYWSNLDAFWQHPLNTVRRTIRTTAAGLGRGSFMALGCLPLLFLWRTSRSKELLFPLALAAVWTLTPGSGFAGAVGSRVFGVALAAGRYFYPTLVATAFVALYIAQVRPQARKPLAVLVVAVVLLNLGGLAQQPGPASVVFALIAITLFCAASDGRLTGPRWSLAIAASSVVAIGLVVASADPVGRTIRKSTDEGITALRTTDTRLGDYRGVAVSVSGGDGLGVMLSRSLRRPFVVGSSARACVPPAPEAYIVIVESCPADKRP